MNQQTAMGYAANGSATRSDVGDTGNGPSLAVASGLIQLRIRMLDDLIERAEYISRMACENANRLIGAEPTSGNTAAHDDPTEPHSDLEALDRRLERLNSIAAELSYDVERLSKL